MGADPHVTTFFGYHSATKIDELLKHAEQELGRISPPDESAAAAHSLDNEAWVLKFMKLYVRSIAARVVQRAQHRLKGSSAAAAAVAEFYSLARTIIPEGAETAELIRGLAARKRSAAAAVADVAHTSTGQASASQTMHDLHQCTKQQQQQRQCLLAFCESAVRRAIHFQTQHEAALGRDVKRQESIDTMAHKEMLKEHQRRLAYLRKQQRSIRQAQGTEDDIPEEVDAVVADLSQQAMRDKYKLVEAQSRLSEATVLWTANVLQAEQSAADEFERDMLASLRKEGATLRDRTQCNVRVHATLDPALLAYRDAVREHEDAMFVSEFARRFSDTSAASKNSAGMLHC